MGTANQSEPRQFDPETKTMTVLEWVDLWIAAFGQAGIKHDQETSVNQILSGKEK